MTRTRRRVISIVLGVAVCFVVLRALRHSLWPAGQERLAHLRYGEQNHNAPERPNPIGTQEQPEVTMKFKPVVKEDVPRLLEKLFKKHKAADREIYTAPLTRFAREKGLSLTEGRLVALSFPDEMGTLLKSIVTDPTRDPQDRFYSIRLLGYLAYAGNKACESYLVQAAHDTDAEISGLALKQLYPVDLHGSYRSLYLEKCAQEEPYAFDALAHWADSGNASLMNKYLEENREHSFRPVLAEKVVKCYGILFSNDWAARLESIIKDPDSTDFNLTPWAIQSAKTRPLPGLREALRERLKTGLDSARVQAQAVSKKLPTRSIDASAFLEQYRSTPMDNLISDAFHDDALIALAESGGELTPPEKMRLRTFGYVGDPNARLAELIAQDQ